MSIEVTPEADAAFRRMAREVLAQRQPAAVQQPYVPPQFFPMPMMMPTQQPAAASERRILRRILKSLDATGHKHKDKGPGGGQFAAGEGGGGGSSGSSSKKSAPQAEGDDHEPESIHAKLARLIAEHPEHAEHLASAMAAIPKPKPKPKTKPKAKPEKAKEEPEAEAASPSSNTGAPKPTPGVPAPKEGVVPQAATYESAWKKAGPQNQQRASDVKGGLQKAYKQAMKFVEFSNGLVPFRDLYQMAQDVVPDLSIEEFHRNLLEMDTSRDVELRVLNEVREDDSPETSMDRNGRRLHWVMWKDPVKDAVSGVFGKSLAFFRKAFDEAKHPRADDGKFISKMNIEAAKKSPEKAAKLRAETTDPVQREKLDAALEEPESEVQPHEMTKAEHVEAQTKKPEPEGYQWGEAILQDMSKDQLRNVFSRQDRKTYSESMVPKTKAELIQSILAHQEKNLPGAKDRSVESGWDLRSRTDASQQRQIDDLKATNAAKRSHADIVKRAHESGERLHPAVAADYPELGENGAGEGGKHPLEVKLHDAVSKGIGLTDEQCKTYTDGISKVVGAMPPAAADKAADALKQVAFHASSHAVTDAIIAKPGLHPQAVKALKAAKKKGSLVGGAYSSDGSIDLDGDQLTGYKKQTGKYAEGFGSVDGVYAHELTHAIDGPEFQLSKSDEWFWAHNDEMAWDPEATDQTPPLTEYAQTDAAEGFAEFGRLLYGSEVPTADIQRDFPKASEFFKKRGLFPAERMGIEAKIPEMFSERISLGDSDASPAHADVLIGDSTPASEPTPGPTPTPTPLAESPKPEPKHSVARTVAIAHTLHAKTGKAKVEALRKLRESFAQHTHAELKQIKAQTGIRASGTKAEQAEKVGERAARTNRDDRRHYTGPVMTVDEAHDAIKAHDHTAPGESIKLASRIAGQLTGKQLNELKKKLGLRASGVNKFDLAYKVATRANVPAKNNTLSEPIAESDNGENQGIATAEPPNGRTGLPDAEPGSVTGRGDTGTDEKERGVQPFKPGIRLVRGEHTQQADAAALDPSLTGHLTPDQQHGAALAVKAMKENGGFLNNDSTGVGKTRQQLAVGQTFANEGKKVLIIAPKSVTKADFKKGTLSGSFKDDSEAMGISLTVNDGDSPLTPGSIHVTTYERLKDIKDKIDKDTVVLMDESHYTKNHDSARAGHAKDITKAAHSVMYSTATPGDNALHIGHLDRMGIYGTAGKTKTLEKLGMELHDQHIGGGKMQKIWRVKPGTTHDEVQRRLSGLFDQATKDGLMIRRELGLDGVEFQTNHVQLTPEQNAEMQAVYDKVMQKTGGADPEKYAAALAKHQAARAKATGFHREAVSAELRRMGVEANGDRDHMQWLRAVSTKPDLAEKAFANNPEKLAAALQASKDLGEASAELATAGKPGGGNRAVALMAARMHQEHMKIPHMVEQVKRDLAEGRRPVVFAARVNDVDPSGGTYGDEAKDALATAGISSPGTIPELKRQLIAAGVHPDDIAEMHGDASEKPDKAMKRFQEGKAKIMLTTPQSGGTGVNLDDTKGDAPRSIHIMTPPFSANDMAQMIGRVHRLNTKSAARVHAVLSDHANDQWGASILHSKMRNQGAMTSGTYSDSAGKLLGDKFQVHDEGEPEPAYEWGESLRDTRHSAQVPYAQKDAAAKHGGMPHNIGTRESPQWTTRFPSKEHYDRFKAEQDAAKAAKPTPTPIAIRSAIHHGGRSHSFTKLKSGDWGARVSADSQPGDTATLTTKSGSTKQVKLGRKVWSGGGVSLHEID